MDQQYEALAMEEKLAVLKQLGTGFRPYSDPLFRENNEKIFKPFVRLGVYNFDEEELCHRTTYVHCNVPNCNKQFDTIFAYESHYNLLHRYTCSQCSKQLPSAHLLDLHLSEKHDSFFAVQAERKPMFACYLEECDHKSVSPAERRDHCIAQHKFPHDFRFDGYTHIATKRKKDKKYNKQSEQVDQDMEIAPGSSTSAIDASKGSTEKMETSTFKPIRNFSFGHGSVKTFNKEMDKSYARQLTKKTNSRKKTTKNVLENEKMVEDLLDSLPQ